MASTELGVLRTVVSLILDLLVFLDILVIHTELPPIIKTVIDV